jgi:alpha-glucosidase
MAAAGGVDEGGGGVGGGGAEGRGDEASRWWRGGVFYQIYPRSYADSNGDGVGDLGGIIGKLDHLARLGVDGVWLSPVTCSPNRDWGYDVSDYRDIDPDYGTLEDLDTLVREAGRRKIVVLMDLVPNHTSDQHAWFVDSSSGRDSAHRDYYVWADPKADGSPPNNWVSIFGGPAWELDEASGQFYLHNFEAAQPDLNWWSEDVRREFDEIVRFWWDRGVAGFRIDVCNMMIKDAELRDNPAATEDDPIEQQFFGVKYVYNTDRPEAHDILQHWRTIADGYSPERLLIGETNVETVERLSEFYGSGHDELHGGFNFQFMFAPFEAAALRDVVERTEALLPPGAWPTWHGSNHDFSRLSSRWAGGDPAKVKLALLMLLSLRGTPFLYAGDEIGLVDGEVPKEEMLDPVGIRFYPYAGRDAERTPMPWHGGPGGGFTEPGVRPWLPMADPAACNVADQEGDPGSVLSFCRRVLAARRATEDLAVGSYRTLPSGEGTWAYARGAGTVVALNLSDAPASFEGVAGRVELATDGALEGSAVEGALTVGPWGGAIVVTSGPS